MTGRLGESTNAAIPTACGALEPMLQSGLKQPDLSGRHENIKNERGMSDEC